LIKVGVPEKGESGGGNGWIEERDEGPVFGEAERYRGGGGEDRNEVEKGGAEGGRHCKFVFVLKKFNWRVM
jgi:hypothetical protein